MIIVMRIAAINTQPPIAAPTIMNVLSLVACGSVVTDIEAFSSEVGAFVLVLVLPMPLVVASIPVVGISIKAISVEVTLTVVSDR